MNPVLLYLILLKATLTSFSGLTSLPMVHNDLVVKRHVLTSRELNTAVAAGRIAPGPNGQYLISAGYIVAGYPGAVAGWLAMVTPAFLVIPLLRYIGRRADSPRVRGTIQTVTLAAAGLIAATAIPMARDGVTTPMTLAIAAATFGVLAFTRVETAWVMLAAALCGMVPLITCS